MKAEGCKAESGKAGKRKPELAGWMALGWRSAAGQGRGRLGTAFDFQEPPLPYPLPQFHWRRGRPERLGGSSCGEVFSPHGPHPDPLPSDGRGNSD